MEKRKIDLTKYADMHEEKTFKGNDGTEIAVRNHISFVDKEALANELVSSTVADHDGSCVYTSAWFEKIRLYMIAKYYTNVDVDGCELVDVADFMINNGLVDEIDKYIGDDFDVISSIYWNTYYALEAIYKDDGSLSKALRSSFGFLFNGEDIAESLAKAEAAKDTVYGAIEAWRKVEKEKEENVHNGKMLVAGNMINFAKKE